jgi:RimJ/RimL family protein N-acetyltransferase
MATLTTIVPMETPRLLLREIMSKDVRQLTAFMLQPGYQRHIALRLRDGAAVADFVARSVARQGDERRRVFHLAAEDKACHEVIGDGFLIQQGGDVLELGWGVHPAMWSMGLGTEIGQALLGLAFEQFRAQTVWCKVMSANEASLRLARRIGFRHDRAEPDFPAGHGRFEPVDLFRMTAEDYFDLPY